jgi:subtilisin family serine protease
MIQMIRAVAIAVVLMTLLLFAIAACQPIQPMQSIQTVQPVQPESQSPVREGETGRLGDARVDGCLAVVNQAILTGEPGPADAAWREFKASDVWRGIAEVDSFVFIPADARDQTQSEGAAGPAPAAFMQLPLSAVLLEGEGLAEIEALVEQEKRLGNFPPEVQLAPNFVVGAIESQGLIAGEGHSPSHTPFGDAPAYIPSPPAMMSAYTGQWALDEVTNTVLYSDVSISAAGGQGTGVKIAVFDTSPFTLATAMTLESVEANLPDGNHVMPLLVQYADILGPSLDHGVFVASLAHALAPDATLYLYRVLNEDGIGNIYTLAKQMTHFYQHIHGSAGPGIAKSVVNLSLSVACDNLYNEPDFEQNILALNHIITQMHEAGVVMVAAAGNSGMVTTTSNLSRPISAFPASHPDVIGVGATNRNHGGPTCYSHQADIFAPGGGADSQTCRPLHAQCVLTSTLPGACEYGLVGLATKSPTRLAFWSGTSFATPLISGLLALWIDDAGSPSSNVPMTQTGQGNVIDVSALQEELFGSAAQYGDTRTSIEFQQSFTSTGVYTYYVLR